MWAPSEESPVTAYVGDVQLTVIIVNHFWCRHYGW